MMQRVNDILKDLKGRAGAEAAFLTSSDGLLLGAVQDRGIDLEPLAAYAASTMMTSESMGESVNSGIPESVIVTYQDKAVVMSPIGPVVAILLGSSGQLGNLRLQMKRAIVDLSAALKDELDLRTGSEKAVMPELKVPILEEPALEESFEEIAIRQPAAAHTPGPAQRVERESVDPELNGNGRRTIPSTRRGTPVNLR